MRSTDDIIHNGKTLTEILRLHRLWLDCKPEGVRACLAEANLAEADLAGANLARACLAEANLAEADLAGANLAGARLVGANLEGAYLEGAYLVGAKSIPAITAARLSVLPDEGDVIGWKKCRGGVIVKLRVPADAKRSNATGRKCRAEYVDVIEVIGADVGISTYDGKTEYRAGWRVMCDKWGEDRWVECAGGIHFFITRAEAEAH